jgi:hypothetical protein
MKRVRETVFVLLSILILASGCSSIPRQDLLDQGYKKIGYQAYIKEKPEGSGFETYFESPTGKPSVISYLRKELKILKEQAEIVKLKNTAQETDQIAKRISSIEYLLSSMKTTP